MKITKDTQYPFAAFAVEADGNIKPVKIVRCLSSYLAYTSRGQRLSLSDLAAKKSVAIKLAERKLKEAQKRATNAQTRCDLIAANIKAAREVA